jgi:hypothetical protein
VPLTRVPRGATVIVFAYAPVVADVIEEGLAMTLSGEMTTRVVDVTEFSLEKLRTCDDPFLSQSINALITRPCNHIGVLQNQVREDI